MFNANPYAQNFGTIVSSWTAPAGSTAGCRDLQADVQGGLVTPQFYYVACEVGGVIKIDASNCTGK